MATTEITRPVTIREEELVASLNAAMEAGHKSYEWALQQMEAEVPVEEICIAIALRSLEER